MSVGAQAYVAARSQGSEAGDVLLDMSQALLSFNYCDTFVNAFDVSAPALFIMHHLLIAAPTRNSAWFACSFPQTARESGASAMKGSEPTILCMPRPMCPAPKLAALSCSGAKGVSASAQVANKVIELKMLHSGQEVCCQSDGDRARFERSQANHRLQQ